MQNVKIWLNWVFTWVFMLCSKQYISKNFYVKSLWPSSKTALFGFIHVDRILQIFYRSLLFSLPNLLGEMGVGMWEFRYEKSSTSDTLQSRSPREDFTKEHLVWFLKWSGVLWNLQHQIPVLETSPWILAPLWQSASTWANFNYSLWGVCTQSSSMGGP